MNIGRILPARNGFESHIVQGVNGFIPATKALEIYNARDIKDKIARCADRKGKNPADMLRQYVRNANGETTGLHSPLPIILVAYGRGTDPVSPDMGMSLGDEVTVTLEDKEGAPNYKLRYDFVEKAIQLVFVAREDETAFSMASQLRTYLCQFGNRRFPVTWKFGGYQTDFIAMLETDEPIDELHDMESRSNISVILWNLKMRFQVPYLRSLGGSIIQAGDFAGKEAGFPALARTDIQLKDNEEFLQAHGKVENKKYLLRTGDWTPVWDGQ